VQAALRAIAEAAPEAEVDVRGPSLEGVFLDLMRKEEEVLAREELASEAEKDTIDSAEKDSGEPTVPTLAATPLKPATAALVLTPGRPQGLLAQARTVFYKRALIARRAWLTPALALLVAVAGACVPLVFVRAQAPGCVRRFQAVYPQSLFLPTSTPWLGVQFGLGGLRGDAAAAAPNASVSVLQAPPGVLNSTLGPALGNVSTFDVKDNTSFTSTVREQYRALELGGVSFDFAGEQDQALFAWEASPPGTTGLVLLNLVDNVLLSRATNASSPGAPPPLLAANYATFPYPATGTLVTLKWVAFFGAAMVSPFSFDWRGRMLTGSAGSVSRVLFAVRVARAQGGRAGDAAEQRAREPGRDVARPPRVRRAVWTRSSDAHHDCVRDSREPVPWPRSLRTCTVFPTVSLGLMSGSVAGYGPVWRRGDAVRILCELGGG
jgi:hypothetical protein